MRCVTGLLTGNTLFQTRVRDRGGIDSPGCGGYSEKISSRPGGVPWSRRRKGNFRSPLHIPEPLNVTLEPLEPLEPLNP